MSIVMNAKMQKFQYDKTIEARVVSTKEKTNGIYKVEFEDAIFDAYSNDNSRYYEGDTVYVHIPKGDFSQQKHIVGRKVDIENEPERTFTFKMPFDDFLSLEDLTYQDAATQQVHGYIANHPLHGIDNDSIDYNKEIIDLNAQLQSLSATFKKNILLINTYQVDFLRYMTPVAIGYTIADQYPIHSTKSYLNIIEELLAQDFEDLIQLNQAVEQVKQQILLGIKSYGDYNKYINQNEYNKILEMIGTDSAIITDDYDAFINTLNTSADAYQENITQQLSSVELLNRQNEILSNADLTVDERQNALAELEETYNNLRQESMAAIIEDNNQSIVDIQIAEKENDIEWPDYYKQLIMAKNIDIDNNIGAKGRLINKITKQYKEAEKLLQDTLAKYTLLKADQEGAKESNINWLYTWINEDDSPCLFDQLGVAADFQTLLGDYRPCQGVYGLKLIVRGMTKPTEDLASIEQTKTLYFLNTIDFYGNTYAFYNYYTQQKLFDVSDFQKLLRIDVYFWQDHRDGYEFKDEQMALIPWRMVSPNGTWQDCPPNIMVTNVKLLMGVDANSFTTDKVFLYTYDNLTYGINPYLNSSRILEDTRKLQFAWVHKLEDGTAELINSIEKLKNYNANIYWYQYEYGVAQDTSIYAWRQGGINWKWLENQCSIDNGTQVYNKFSIDVQPDISKAQEKYRVVLAYNNIPLRSDLLIFQNIDQTIETHADDLINEVVFRFLKEDANGQLVEDSDIGVFNVYDESNLCIKDENNISYAAKWYYVQIWIRNNDNGEYTPLAIDDVEDSIDVIWGNDELTNGSMINQFVPPTIQDLSSAVLLPTNASYSEVTNQNIINITRKFNIRNRLDMQYTHNNITAVVRRNGREYRLQKTLYFGRSGSMGSEYSISLHQLIPNGNCMVDGEPFSIYATVADKFGNKVENQNYYFTWELLSPTIITKWPVPEGTEDSIDNKTWQDSSFTIGQEGNYANNKISGIIHNGMPLVIRVGVHGAADYDIYQTTAFRLVDKSGFNNLYTISVPDRVEFRSDGKAPIAITAPFYVSDIQDDENDVITEYHPHWKLRQWYKPTYRKEWTELLDSNGEPAPAFFGLNEKIVTKREIATNENPYVWAEFIDTNGTIPNYDGQVSNREIDGGKQVRYNYLLNYIESAYNQATIIYQESDQNADDIAAFEQAQSNYESYLDKINLAASKIVPSYTTYALNPYINTERNNNVAWYWDDALAENYYTVIEFQNDKDLPYYVRQAIAMTRNEYSSSLVNSWDGSLLIDKENNAFLSKMISAGSKDQNNKFTGVMMGDWSDNADESMQDIGLYGFTQGAQVFGLKTDGTGFIGKTGKGQIQFDGNYSLISNYDKSCYINLDPIRLTYDSAIDNSTTTGYSSYFLYAKVPKSSTASIQGEGDLLESTYWARNFMRDTVNDYFIVDPNNGILTTGGIIARYGKIGNWLISSSGLYQRHTRKDEYGNSLYNNDGYLVTDKFMYLGYPDRNMTVERQVRDRYINVIQKIEERKQREIEYKRAEIMAKVVEILGKDYAKQIFTVDPIHYFNYGWATLEVINYLEDCLIKFEKQYTIGDNINDVLLSIIYDDKNLSSIINETNDKRAYHTHYFYNKTTGEYEVVTGEDGRPTQYYTGGALVYLALLGVKCKIGSYEIDHDTALLLSAFHYAEKNYPSTSIKFYETEYFENDLNKYPKQWQEYWSFYNYFINHNQEEPYAVTLSRNMSDLTVEDLQKYINIYSNIYKYYLDGYNQMLQEMIEAGTASLKETELQEYIQRKQELEDLYLRAALENINKKYDQQLKDIEKQIQQEVLAADNGDNNRYAIYCGEDDIMTSTLYRDPVTGEYRPNNAFFTVDWTGTMMARKGILGYNSPWIIDDNGLTQKNKYGIIYLGAPKYTMEEDYDPNKTITINNQIQDYNGQQSNSLIENTNNTLNSNNYYTYDQFIMFAGPKIAATPSGDLDNNIIPEHYANTIDEAYFALKADGTLFSRRGRIGSWYIGDTVLQTLWKQDDNNTTYPYNIVFDAYNAQIRMGGGRTIIYGNGKIVLNNPTGSLNRNLGTIELAGYALQGWTTGTSVPVMNSVSWESDTVEEGMDAFTTYTVNWQYTNAPKDTKIYSTTDKDLTRKIKLKDNSVKITSNNILNPQYFSIYEKDLDDNSGSYPGVQLVTGQLQGKNGYGTVFYPLHTELNNATLGLPDAPWNLYAHAINAGTIYTNNLSLTTGPLFIGSERAATYNEVWNLYIDLLNRIKDLGSGSSDTAGQARSGSNGIGNALTNLNGKKFIKEITIDKTYLTAIGQKFNFNPSGDGGNGDSADADTEDEITRTTISSANISHGGDGEGGGTVKSFLDASAKLHANLLERIVNLEARVNSLETDLSSLTTTFQGHTHSFSGDGGDNIVIGGSNTHISISISGNTGKPN